jgi:hypothetical protein
MNSSLIRQAGASLQYLSSSPLPCAPPDARDQFYSQQNSVIDERPKHTSTQAPPATPFLLIWTQSPPSDPSRRAKHRRGLATTQESPEHRRRQPPGRRSLAGGQNPSSPVRSSP